MTVTPPRTEGQTVDTAETLEAAMDDTVKWLRDRTIEGVAELERRITALTERAEAAPISAGLKDALFRSMLAKISAVEKELG